MDTKQKILEILNCTDVKNSNANVDEYSFGGRKFEAAGLMLKEIAMEQFINPEVAKAFITWAGQQTATKVFMECALLFESGFDQLVHRSILVSAPLEKRIARVIQRDGASKTKVEEWIALQMPEEEKARRAHYIIFNEYTPDFQESLCALLEDRIKI
jgi:dephospho-CoA kinase